MSDEIESCSNCAFYKAAPSGKHGYCQRFPPQFTHRDDASGHPRFFSPVVSPNAWCGEYVEDEA